MEYLFRSPIDVDIHLENEEERSFVDIEFEQGRKDKAPVYGSDESVKGAVMIRLKDGRKLDHNGIKIEFVGCIENTYDKGNIHEFTRSVQELASPGEMRQAQMFDFEFKHVEKPYESYFGKNVKLRYFCRVTVTRKMTDVIREKDLWVYRYENEPETNSLIKMDVGIDDCLHIEFEYTKNKYHLRDVIVGKIYFILVRIKVQRMEVNIIRRETIGTPPNQYSNSETVTRFQVMDGNPNRGETIPLRMFLNGYSLTPTFRDVNKKFNVRYYLSLILVDEDQRRYFKQSEITLWRRKDEQGIIA
ncbi:retromer complex subunit Vps26 [Schizosaccharomyces cryophilus OY26]|uniref:Retromer complex subunit Vps26 n=1 Tax=Schizosaccharomyces cryophilus (strain OY26 / ATCC MYA-4695 / CBS 11777 / NBRC 106824 / NRRL Y48691) TaxID=653667 RepID=S9W150_SCHCR|nr:retromer complex subunit Vps26 [Schizosaccharomyces cryophilus OY26]EPY51810.1 retromer complex subunit Vps26 [Schizosaccharomyces cryophilus OY26]